MVESRVEAWDRMERENAEPRRALEPFARVAVTPLRFANVRYGTDTDPERQTFQTPSMHRAFNRAAEVLRAAKDGVQGAFICRRPAIGPACEKQCERCAAAGEPGTLKEQS